jgi:MFS family permease
MNPARSPVILVMFFCIAEAASMAGFALVPSLLPGLSREWSLSATQAGWLSGFFFLGYILAVPVLVSLTDRVDARRVYLVCAAAGGLAQAGFAAFADGLGSALAWWGLAGLGLAGTYMPGLKALTDRLPVGVQSRGTAFYTATFGVGAGLSYLWVELLQNALPWRTLFVVGAACAVLSVMLVWLGVPAGNIVSGPRGMREHWRSVVRDRRILAFCGGYFGHNWELFGFRAWLVAYLTWAQATRPDAWTSMPGLIAAGATFLAVPASILGNEGAQRWGRRRWLTRVMPLSCALALVVSLSGDLSRGLLVPLLLVYGMSMNLDSAALTAGLLTETAAEKRGTALALYSSIGFAGGLIGPVAFGVAVDAFGRDNSAGWAAGFVTLACGVAFGRWSIGRIARSAGEAA